MQYEYKVEIYYTQDALVIFNSLLLRLLYCIFTISWLVGQPKVYNGFIFAAILASSFFRINPRNTNL